MFRSRAGGFRGHTAPIHDSQKPPTRRPPPRRSRGRPGSPQVTRAVRSSGVPASSASEFSDLGALGVQIAAAASPGVASAFTVYTEKLVARLDASDNRVLYIPKLSDSALWCLDSRNRSTMARTIESPRTTSSLGPLHRTPLCAHRMILTLEERLATRAWGMSGPVVRIQEQTEQNRQVLSALPLRTGTDCLCALVRPRV
jgi:hypothetical protein